MTIAHGKTVSITYLLRVEGPEGEIVEEATSQEPMTFTVGDGQALSKLEEHLIGKKAGDTFDLFIASADAHGEESEEHFIEFPKDTFIDEDGNLDEDMLEEGEIIPMQNEDGQEALGIVVEVKLNSVVLDFNHPLVGEDLHFSGRIVSVS